MHANSRELSQLRVAYPTLSLTIPSLLPVLELQQAADDLKNVQRQRRERSMPHGVSERVGPPGLHTTRLLAVSIQL